MEQHEFNIASNSKNNIEAWLSNLSHNPFNLDWTIYNSIEAFWQSLKFEEWSEKWNRCIELTWIESKKYWNNIKWIDYFFYNELKYKVWSLEHQDLMKKALKEQLKQNIDKLKLLLSTWNSNLIHKPQKEDWTYYSDSITIPWEIFWKFLMDLREEFSFMNKFQNETIWKIDNLIK